MPSPRTMMGALALPALLIVVGLAGGIFTRISSFGYLLGAGVVLAVLAIVFRL